MKEVQLRKMRVLLAAAVFCAAFLPTVFAINPQAGEYLRKARVFFDAANYKMSRDYLERAREIDPADPGINSFAERLKKAVDEQVKELRQRADFYLDAKNLPEAEKLFGEVLSLSSDDEYSKIKLKEISGTYAKIDEYKSQGIFVNDSTGRSHDVDMYSAVSLMNRARGFFAQGDRVNALDMVEKVLKREPGYKPALELKERIVHINRLETFIEKAETAFLEGRMRETIDSLNTLIAETPDRHEYVLMRGKAYLKIGRFSEARNDFWKYFQHRPERDTIFPLLSEAYSGLKQYQLAGAFAYNPETRQFYKSAGFRFRCHVYAHPLQYGILALILALTPFAFYFIWTSAEALFLKFSLGSLWLAISCVFTIIFKSPEHCLGNLITVARDLNVAWVNYLTGITLFKIGQIEGAQRFLAYSFVNDAIRPRAYYFFGLTRKLLKHNLYELDFEEAVLSGLGHRKSGWHPKFVKQIERELLISYSKDKGDESFEGMAYKLVEDVTGS